MSGDTKWLKWLAFRMAPQIAGSATKTNIRVLKLTTTSNFNVEIDNDILVPNNVPNQPAANQGELPASGDVIIAVQVEGAGGAYVLFADTAAHAVIDNTDATANQMGIFIAVGTGPYYFMVNPRWAKYLAGRVASSGTTATIRYWVASQFDNNRP
jgi:hypothetical protein